MIQCLQKKDVDSTKPTSVTSAATLYSELAKLVKLAETFSILGLKNSIVDKFFKTRAIVKDYPPQMDAIELIYKHTKRDSPIRKILVDWYVWSSNFTWYELDNTKDEIMKVPSFTADLAMALGARLLHPGRKNPFHGERTSYHERRAQEESEEIT